MYSKCCLSYPERNLKIYIFYFSLKNKFKDSAHEEIAELQKFAISEGFGGEIQMWDVAYWRNRQKEHLYK